MRHLAILVLVVSLFACASPTVSVRQDSATERPQKIEAAVRHLVEAGAPAILDCFHQSQRFGGVSIASVQLSQKRATVDGTVTMKGLLGAYTMDIHVELELATERHRIRVTPGHATAVFAPDPRCPLLQPEPLHALGPAAHDATVELESALTP